MRLYNAVARNASVLIRRRAPTRDRDFRRVTLPMHFHSHTHFPRYAPHAVRLTSEFMLRTFNGCYFGKGSAVFPAISPSISRLCNRIIPILDNALQHLDLNVFSRVPVCQESRLVSCISLPHLLRCYSLIVYLVFKIKYLLFSAL